MIKVNVQKTGNSIKSMMTKRGMTADDLKKALGYADRSTLYRWFRGEAMPSYENLVNLAIVFKCKIRDIVVYEDDVQ
jgi:transcriptional regulator with XRE-family HTH domain